jgi:hypothetical protein
MNDDVDHKEQNAGQSMLLKQKKARLRAILRARVFCPRCPVISPGFDRDPCYGCVTLPRQSQRPMTTVN